MKIFCTPVRIFKNLLNRKILISPKIKQPLKTDIAEFSSKSSFNPIEFKKSKTVEEAQSYAHKYFYIKKLEVADTADANRINRKLTQIYNLTNGRASFPSVIKVEKQKNARYVGSCNYDFVKCVSCPKMESIVTHEIGHYNHYLLSKNYDKMGKLGELQEDGISDYSIFYEFKNNKEAQKLIKKYIRPYATSSPAEFIACTFAKIIDGKKLPPEIYSLYKKYEGPFCEIFCI